MRKLSYREKFVQMNREAKATWMTAAVLILFWWLAAFGTARLDYTIFYMPGWFVTSCIGTYLLSVALVYFLIKRIFVDFDLDEEPDEEPAARRGEDGRK